MEMEGRERKRTKRVGERKWRGVETGRKREKGRRDRAEGEG